MPQPRLPDVKRRRVLDLYERFPAMTRRDMAKRAGVSLGTVFNVLVDEGKIESQSKRMRELRRRIHEEIQDTGDSFHRIAARLRVGHSTVARMAKQPLKEARRVR